MMRTSFHGLLLITGRHSCKRKYHKLQMAAKEKLQLIVMATRVHGIVGGVLIGRIAQHVA